MSRVRIGFVGTGYMGQAAHLANYARLRDDAEVVAIAEQRSELGQRVARRYGVEGVYTSAEQMIESEKLDALVIPQQFSRHLQVVGPLYRYGLPVLTEKPLAMSTAVGASLLQLLDESPSPFHMVGYHKRSDPAVERARALATELRESGRWGALRYVRMTMAGGDWIVNAFDDLVMTDEVIPPAPDDQPDGDADYVAFVNFWIHQVNLLRYLLGEQYRVTHAEPTGRVLVGESASGVPLTLEMDPWGEPAWDESVILGYDGGTITVRLPAPLAARRAGELIVRGDLGAGYQTATPDLPPVHAMLAQARNFVAAVRGDAPPPCEAHDAFEDLRLADQYFAAKRG